MLDIRAIAYVDPASEVPFAPVKLTVLLENFADETGLISGSFRIYNGSTGLLIFQSDIAPLELSKGEAADVSSLTEFNPPAPADDTYFVLFDGIASNALVPDGITLQLGGFYFDVKPAPLGPIPAGHHVTHEDTGIDEVNVTGLAGLLENPQTPILHHLEHETGGSDEINVTGLAGVLADPQPPTHHHLKHETGGNDEINVTDLAGLLADRQTPIIHHLEHESGGGDEVDHGKLIGLADDDHPQYRLRHETFIETDFLISVGGTHTPWYSAAVLLGTSGTIAAEANHPGIYRTSSSTSANSGYLIQIAVNSIRLSGGETSRCWHRPTTLAGTTRHHGFHDSTTVADPVDGVWIWQDPATGIIYGRTRSNSVGSTTGTGHQLVTATWYFEKIVVNADASRVDFYLYDAAGALLWTDNLTTNIPTAAGREVGHVVVTTNSGTTAVVLDDLDYLSILIPDRRPNP